LAERCGEPVDEARLLRLCLFHDLPEARTGDQNYVNRRYVQVDDAHVRADIAAASPLGPALVAAITEFEEGDSLEAQLARDADQLEMLALLREEEELGNARAKEWQPSCLQRLHTDAAKAVAEEMLATPTDDWWFHDKEDRHWVNGGKEERE
ncbi:MAG TPA: HD domain-containing protein, partial [Armatimonadota bacterium]|nr:HD domain-containing protein [Armatimonadota bacterium]